MINGRSRLICLIGDPVSHSKSPLIHNTGFEELGLDYAFMCFRSGIDELGDTIKALKRLNARGFSCTMPVKVAVCDHLDELSQAAELMHAVNCVVIEDDGRMIGHNTDGIGYVEAARKNGAEVTGRVITILGGGGAATAIAVQCAIEGADKIMMFNRKGRSSARADDITARLSKQTACTALSCDIADEVRLREALGASDLLINATPVGMAPDAGSSPIKDMSVIRKELIVTDAIYNPEETRLIKEARAKGCLAFGGSDMLLYQAVAAFRLWTGEELPLDAVAEKLSRRTI